MRAARVSAFGEPVEVVEVPEPEAGPGRTLVRVEAATVGHIDRSIWTGSFFRHPPLPYTPGVEAAGTVVSSETWSPGDRVWVRGGGLGTQEDGTWAELVAAPDSSLGSLPAGVPWASGAAFFSPCTSAWVSLHDVAAVQAGETVLVTGASGAVGAMAVQLARAAGAVVVGTVSSAAKLELVPPGARTVVVPRGAAALPSDIDADVVIDTVGGPLLEAALAAVRPGGRVVMVGYLAGHEVQVDVASLVQRDVSLLPLNMISREGAGRAAAPELLARLARGELALSVRTFALRDVMAGLDWLGSGGQVGRAVLLPGPAGSSIL